MTVDGSTAIATGLPVLRMREQTQPMFQNNFASGLRSLWRVRKLKGEEMASHPLSGEIQNAIELQTIYFWNIKT
jgi:hypothetical protein